MAFAALWSSTDALDRFRGEFRPFGGTQPTSHLSHLRTEETLSAMMGNRPLALVVWLCLCGYDVQQCVGLLPDCGHSARCILNKAREGELVGQHLLPLRVGAVSLVPNLPRSL